MTPRERWQRTMHFLPVDYLPDEEFGYWTDTLEVWHRQGLPSWVRTNEQADLFFGFSPRLQAPVAVGLKPAFRARTLEETEHHRIVVDGNGVKCMVHKDGASSIPKYLEFPVRDRASWNRFRRRLDPETPGRYPRHWQSLVCQWEKRDYPLGISMGSLFGWIRNWAGFEGVAVMVYDDPGLFEEIMEHITLLVLDTLEQALRQVRFDFASCWEDMCFNHGPIISPAMFARYMVPRYCRLTEALRAHGVDIVYVDCDGNIDQLVPLWLEAGVNCMFPLEVAAGSNARRYRDLYGERVLLMGGIDKRALIEGKEAIQKELGRVEGLAREGGYIPHVDHRVPPDVTYANYCYYLEAKRERFGIPEPGPWVERLENPARR